MNDLIGTFQMLTNAVEGQSIETEFWRNIKIATIILWNLEGCIQIMSVSCLEELKLVFSLILKVLNSQVI